MRTRINQCFTSDLFTVASGGTLTLGETDGGQLVIDGAYKDDSIIATDALISVGSNGALTMNNGVTLQKNQSSGNGGGVHVQDSGSFKMSGGTISGNAAAKSGGGVYVSSGGTFTMSGGYVDNIYSPPTS
jgi:parallel beta-helix repeat protein